MGVGKNTYYDDDTYGRLLVVAKLEHPNSKDAVNKVIQKAVKLRVEQLEKKHKIKKEKSS